MAGVLSPIVLAFLMNVVARQVQRKRGETVREFLVGPDSIVRVLSMIPAKSQKMRLCEVIFSRRQRTRTLSSMCFGRWRRVRSYTS